MGGDKHAGAEDLIQAAVQSKILVKVATVLPKIWR